MKTLSTFVLALSLLTLPSLTAQACNNFSCGNDIFVDDEGLGPDRVEAPPKRRAEKQEIARVPEASPFYNNSGLTVSKEEVAEEDEDLPEYEPARPMSRVSVQGD